MAYGDDSERGHAAVRLIRNILYTARVRWELMEFGLLDGAAYNKRNSTAHVDGNSPISGRLLSAVTQPLYHDDTSHMPSQASSNRTVECFTIVSGCLIVKGATDPVAYAHIRHPAQCYHRGSYICAARDAPLTKS